MKFKKILALTTAITISLGCFSGRSVKAEEGYNIPMESLKGYWSFEDYEGKTIKDSSNHGKDATIVGNDGSIVDGGINGKGLRLMGKKGQFLSIPSIINTATEDVTISFWVNVVEKSVTQTENTILVQQEGKGRSLVYYTNGNKVGSFVGGANVDGAESIETGQWCNVVIQTNVEKKSVELYINGKLDAKSSVSEFSNSNDPLRIGDHKNSGGLALNGIIDEVSIFDRNLSLDEIKSIYYKDVTVSVLKGQLSKLTEKSRKVYNLAVEILGEEVTKDFLKEIEECEELVSADGNDKNILITKLDLLPTLDAKFNILVNTALENKVLIQTTINDVFRKIDKGLFGANHRYHKNGYGTYDTKNLKVNDEFDKLYDEAGFGSVRYPGGKVSNLFEWKRSIGGIKERKHTIHGDPEQVPEFPYFGVDEAARYAEEKNSEFVYVYNLGNGNKDDAADLVEYLNCEVGENPNGGIDWAKVRADNGRVEPYNVTHFELGNEFQLQSEQGYWTTASKDSVGAYIDGGTFDFNNQRVVEDEDWRSSVAKSNGEAEQEKLIRYFPVVEESLVLNVGGETWNRVDSLANSVAENVYEYNNETGTIKFGNGTNGNIPTVEKEIRVSYSAHRDGYVDYYEEMKKVDSNIKLYASYESHKSIERFGTDKGYDGIVVHPYSGTISSEDAKYYEKILARSDEKVNTVRNIENAIKEIVGEEAAKDKKVVVSEYGIFSDTSRFVKSQINALYTAKSIIGLADIASVPYATKHCLVDFPQGDLLGPGVQAIIQSIVDPETGEIDFVSTPSAKVFTLFNKLTGENVLTERVINNKLIDEIGLEAVDTMITTDKEGNLYLMLVNTAKENVDIRVDVEGFNFTGKTGEVMLVDGPNYDAENTVDNKNNVDVEKFITEEVTTEYLDYSLTPHSVTAIKFEADELVEDIVVDKTELNKLVEIIEKLDSSKYSEESWKDLIAKLSLAMDASINGEITQEQFDQIVNDLKLAMDNLKYKDETDNKPGDEETEDTEEDKEEDDNKPGDEEKDNDNKEEEEEIVIEDEKDNINSENKDELPETGGRNSLYLILSSLILISVGVFILRKRKVNN